MKSLHYVAIMIRLFAIALLIYSLRRWIFVVEVLIDGQIYGIRFSEIYSIATALIPTLFVILLWTFPLTIANVIVNEECNKEIKPINAHSFLTVLIIFLGLYFIFYDIIDSIYLFTLYQATKPGTISDATISLTDDNVANMVATAVEFILAFILIAKSKTIAFHLLRFSR